jgi:hypothetical protein
VVVIGGLQKTFYSYLIKFDSFGLYLFSPKSFFIKFQKIMSKKSNV